LARRCGRVRLILRQPALDQQISDPLHALAGDSHLAGDAGDRQRLWQHGTKDLPPRRGEPERASHVLGDLEELSVEPECRQGEAAEQFPFGPHAQPAMRS
jgi:hypothetical protein